MSQFDTEQGNDGKVEKVNLRRRKAESAVKTFVLVLGITLSAVASVATLKFESLADTIYQYRETALYVSVFLVLLGLMVFRAIERSSSVDIVEADREVFVEPTSSGIEFSSPLAKLKYVEDLRKYAAEERILEQGEVPSVAHLNTPFERYVNHVVRALDSRINISERKAAFLLERGKNYMFGGVVFSVVMIAIWQYVERVFGFSYFLIVGMISTSLVFIVVEFLAAWFLKQYRSYVDSSIAYLRVRSVFNRYLLVYYAVNQFGEEDNLRSEMVKILSEDVKWPTHKELVSNDFNYMLEAMGSFTSVVEKLKESFAPTSKGDSSSDKGAA